MGDLFNGYKWIVMTYEEAQRELKAKDPLNIKARKALARTLILRGDSTFLTVYTENRTYPNKDYYTIAHELGHIVLGHLFDFYCTSLNRGGLTKREYSVLEREAEIFAAEFIMPIPVLQQLRSKNFKSIVSVCKVTKQAARIRIKEIQDYKITNDLSHIYNSIKENFNTFIYKKSCTNCGNHIVSNRAVYCKICGNQLKWGDGKMIYNDGYNLDQDGRAVICPICQNEEILDGNHCKICGIYIINRCSNTEGYQNDYNEWVQPCGVIAEGNARYCIHCGEKTTYYANTLLEDWTNFKSNNKLKQGFQPIYDEDPDIPF